MDFGSLNGRQDLSYNFYRAKLDDVVIGNLHMLKESHMVQCELKMTRQI